MQLNIPSFFFIYHYHQKKKKILHDKKRKILTDKDICKPLHQSHCPRIGQSMIPKANLFCTISMHDASRADDPIWVPYVNLNKQKPSDGSTKFHKFLCTFNFFYRMDIITILRIMLISSLPNSSRGASSQYLVMTKAAPVLPKLVPP